MPASSVQDGRELRWLAYVSNESGRFEVYVRPFHGPGGKWQISTSGGAYPTWSRTTRELFYGLNGQLMVAGMQGGRLVPGREAAAVVRGSLRAANRMFDWHPGGTRFAIAPGENTTGVTQDKVTFLFNFFDELRRIAPVAKQ